LGKDRRGKRGRRISLKENRELQVSSNYSNPEGRTFRVCHTHTDSQMKDLEISQRKIWNK
jgi:hypothetical protein